jgi:hypothetical protein
MLMAIDQATKERIGDARSALAELEAATREGLMLLHEIERDLEAGETDRAVANAAALRTSMTEMGKAVSDFARHSILGGDEPNGAA